MPQETNLNVSPYFDDYDKSKNFYKVLFKPGYPVQARELTSLQSILQNQIEQFGNHIFTEGSVVIPGQISYDSPLYAVEIESFYNGIPISLYSEQLVGKTIRGESSGVTARVVHLLKDTDSERSNFTLYIQYLQSGGIEFNNKVFFDSENIVTESAINYGNFTIQPGESICTTISTNSTSQGSSVKISSGIYFVRGFFVKVNEQRIILEQYNTKPSYKVGFNVIESIITSDEDDTLYDNAQGFSNYAAPGADRFSIELELTKKDLNEESENFVEILRVINGSLQSLNRNLQYSLIRDELARRTADESGNYYVKPFTLFVRDCLNDRVLSNGIYYDDQLTVNGNTPSEDKMVYQIGPGKAYVNGYDVETISPRLLEIEKTREVGTLEKQIIRYNAGSLFVVNNVYGSASVGLGTTSVVSLMSDRLNLSDKGISAGSTIGISRVYDFIPESNYVDDTSRLNLRLFDLQTFTEIGLTRPITLNSSTAIKGKRSNATGFLRENVDNDRILLLYNVSGRFLENEPIIVNGIDNGRLINFVKDYGISDIKSVYSVVGISTFNADLVLDKKTFISSPGTQYTITPESGGISTVSSGLGTNFLGRLSVGDIVSYSNPALTSEIVFNKVNSISSSGSSFTIVGISSVSGVCYGGLPTEDTTVSNILKLSSTSNSRNSSLLTKINRENISSINFEGGKIVQRRTFKNIGFVNSSLTILIPPNENDIFFDTFDEDKFVITYLDGSIEPLRIDKYNIDTTGKRLTFNGLTKTSGIADVIATVVNLDPSSKIKKLNKVSSLVVRRSKYTSSGIGTSTLNDGLSYSSVYGTRVQDEEISLNLPDVVRVLAIYESSGIEDPSLPKLVLSSFTGPTNNNTDYIIGERITGKKSGAVAIIVSRGTNINELEYVYLNTSQFISEEIILGKESGVQSIISSNVSGDKNITKNFILDDGQRDTIYDYSRLIRRGNVIEPNKKLKIVFQNYTIDSSDTGEFITANSYSQENYKHDVPLFNNTRVSDYIDIRPRVAPYNLLSTKSPFEFDSRVFASDGQYSQYILSPDENLILSYSYYLPRIDRVFLNQDGTFEISKGIASERPLPAPLKVNALDIALINIPPYVYNVKNVLVDMSKHKRYRMSDISLLENRIQRLEEFTVLSALENKTENFIIKDAETGLDRFKCGFFVDDFKDHSYHNLQHPSFRCSIDKITKTLRPLNYTTSIDLQLGSEVIEGLSQTYNPNKDHSYVEDLGSPGIKKTGDLITLNYEEVLYDEQLLATKTESVTAFLVRYWSGYIQLNPPLDTWVDEKFLTTNSFNEVRNTLDPRPDENITITNNLVENNVVYTNPPIILTGDDAFDWLANARTLLAENRNPGTIWLADGTRVSGQKIFRSSSSGRVGAIDTILDIVNGDTIRITGGRYTGQAVDAINAISQYIPRDIATEFVNTLISQSNLWALSSITFTPGIGIIETSETTTSTNSVSNTTTFLTADEIISQDTISESISHYTETVRYLRSRNIEFDVKGLKPRTKFYAFFQGINVDAYITPKLLEIDMISGRFEIGETVESDPHFIADKLVFRLCKPDHKTGPHDGSGDGEKFNLNPYTQTPFEDEYSESSSVLNVDTRSLQLPSEVDYYGRSMVGMKLIGKTSGAVAIIRGTRLVSDNGGRLLGSLFVPDPNIPGNPSWINGENTLTVIDTPSLDIIKLTEYIPNSRINESSAEADFYSNAITNVTETNILTTRNVTIIPGYNINTTTITNTTTNTTTITQTVDQPTVNINQPYDPLAQSFYVFEDTGIFLTSIEVFFETKDEDNMPVTLQIRPLLAGVPSNVVIPFSEVTLTPDEINLSVDGTVPTKFTFPSPVFLSGPQQQTVRQAPIASQTLSEYAIVLISNSSNYRVFVTEMGQNDILSGVLVSKQPTLGSMYKSQNGSVWTPSQLEDLKYRIYRADFVNEGLVRFFNPKLSLSNKKVTVTGPNQVVPLSKRIIVGLGSTGFDVDDIVPGISITQESASAKLIGIAGSITIGTGVTITNAGFGYTDGTFNDVDLLTETGYGQGAKANIVVQSNQIYSVDITSGGLGYQIGDSLLVPEIGQNVGFGGKVVVTSISSENAFVLDNVQGTFTVGISTLQYINDSGDTVIVGSGVTISSITQDQYYDGLHMKIYHPNHGMHSPENYVRISKFRPLNGDTNTKSIEQIDFSDTTISIQSSEGFETFEGLPVDMSNPGYVIIGDEVISYTSYTSNSLVNLTRGVDGTQAQSYDLGVYVYKYEFNGISLRRINKIHNLSEVSRQTHKTDIDSYHIKIDTGNEDYDGNPIGQSRINDLYFNQTTQTGQSGTFLTNNVQFEMVMANISNIIPSKTNISGRIRTFSGTSIGGNEKSFVDNAFEELPLSGMKYFKTPRIIASDVNEDIFITQSPGNKSLTAEFLFNSTDSRVSPVIDLANVSLITCSNLLNNPLGIGEESSYELDDRVRSIYDDNHSSIYISKQIKLKIPANSIKVLLSASRNDTNDIRVLYQLFRNDSPQLSQNFELFPGYSNYTIDGSGIKRVIDPSLNDGSEDSFIRQSSDRSFRDYEYSVDDLPDFDGFAIKIVMAGNNQATPPFIRQLRAIATVKPKI